MIVSRPRILASLRMMSRDPARFGRQATSALDVLQRYIATPFVRPNDHAIIVLGNPKAGTTAIAALLAGYGDLSVTLDLWPRLRRLETLAAVHAGELPFEAFVRRFRADFARDVVKDPHLTFLYPQLRQRFPDARFVMVMRDPRDNIRSILNRLRLPGDLEQLDPEAYERMRPLWEAILKSPWLDVEGNYVERLAGRWAAAARVYIDHADAIELIRFEDFLADKMGAIAALADRLEIERRGRIEDKLDTPFQPPGDRSVGWRAFFGANLHRLESRSAAEARALGYMETGRNSTSEG